MTDSRKRIAYLAVDYLSTLLAVIVFSLVRYYWIDKLHTNFSLSFFLSTPGVVLTALLFPPFMLILYYLSGFYVRVNFKSRIREFFTTMLSASIGAICYFLIVLLNDLLPKRTSNYVLILILFAILFLIVFVSRFTLTTILLSRSKRRSGVERLVYIGDSGKIGEIKGRVNDRELSLRSKILFDDDNATYSQDSINDILARELTTDLLSEIDGFYVALPKRDNELGLKILGELYKYDLPIYVNSDYYRLLTSRVVYENIFSDPLMDISRSVLPDSVVAVKRAADVLVALTGLLITSPAILGFALAVKLTSKGPAFFKQERIGYHRKPFKLIKLRSMIDGAEKAGPALSSSADPRITPLGAFMRKYRIDELPNLWNVLKGDMSLVGPRPEREYFLQKIMSIAPYSSLLHQVRPGLTSLGMVKFGYASSVEEMIERLKYDLIYIQNLSIALDLRIMFYTIRTVIRGEGK